MLHPPRLVALSTVAVLVALAGACGSGFSEARDDGAAGAGGAAGGGAGGAPGGSTTTGGSAVDAATDAPGCLDGDGDGVTDCAGDCDDGDPAIAPGKAEVCGDAKDNDCSGGIDEVCQGLGTFVSSDKGSDAWPGTQAQPVKTIQAGMNNAKTIGGGVDVYVAKGHYLEAIQLAEGVSLLGGFDPDQGWTRDVANHDTAILCPAATCVTAGPLITRATELDGFRIMGWSGTVSAAPGTVAVALDGSPVVRACKLFGGDVTGNGAWDRSSHAVLVRAKVKPGPLITGNQIQGGTNTFSEATGIRLHPGTLAEIEDNQITGGNGLSVFGVVAWGSVAGATLKRNVITAGTAAPTSSNASSWGIGVEGELFVSENFVNTNLPLTSQCAATTWCGGLRSFSSEAVIVNNVLFGVRGGKSAALSLQQAEGPAGAVIVNSNYLAGAGMSSGSAGGNVSAAIHLRNGVADPNNANAKVGFVRNNILVAGAGDVRFVVYEDNEPQRTCRPAALENNSFWFDPGGVSSALYRTWDGAVAGVLLDISDVNNLPFAKQNRDDDPEVDATFHLLPGSPCIDAGTSVDAPPTDLDGELRPMGSQFDIGPDEAG